MSRVADAMRRGEQERIARMTPGERMVEALRLGQEAIAAYAAAHGLDREEARRRLKRAAQVGRRPSRVMLEIIE
jgi:cell division inhibitor SulA